MDPLTLKEIIGYGLNGFQTVVIYMLWQRLNIVTDRIFLLLQQGSAERSAIASTLGMTTEDLTLAAAEVRRRRAAKPDQYLE